MSDESLKCVRCEAPLDQENYDSWGYLTALRPTGSQWEKACNACCLAVWQSPVRFVFHWGAPRWAESALLTKDILQRTKQWFENVREIPVHIFPRAEVDTLKWQATWSYAAGDTKPRGPYSYRGWCAYNGIILIVDETETPASLEWLLYHELGHAEQQQLAKMSDAAWDKENRNEGRTTYQWEDDLGHEQDSEERHVNRIANAYMGGKEYARPWWRPRVIAKNCGVTVLPDQHAPEGSPARDVWVRMRLGLPIQQEKPYDVDRLQRECEKWYRVAPPAPPAPVDAVYASIRELGPITSQQGLLSKVSE